MTQAIRHGLDRVRKPFSKEDAGSSIHVRQRAFEEAGKLLLEKHWFEIATEQLDFKLPEDLPPFSVYAGFILCFYHALWQAVQHGYLARIESGLLENTEIVKSPFLRVEFGWNYCLVENRASTFDRQQASNDRRFYDLVERKLNAQAWQSVGYGAYLAGSRAAQPLTYSVSGPGVLNESARTWGTKITLTRKQE